MNSIKSFSEFIFRLVGRVKKKAKGVPSPQMGLENDDDDDEEEDEKVPGQIL